MISLLVVGGLETGVAQAGDRDDWPAYKRDASRSGVTTAALEFPLRPTWGHGSGQAPSPAWAEPGRSLNMLDFDYAFQPVSSGGLVFYGSSADDSVRALDAATGAVVWTYPTGGPIRFAPHIDRDKCYFASDDGIAYCLDAKTGAEIWKTRTALNDRRLIANGRLTSRWPCRSGVLVKDGVVFVSAGMWPSEGVYLYALDADTGKTLWCNDTSCYDYVETPHAPSTSFGGPAPQGYLLAAKNTLVVPTGRGAPAGFDARSGKLLHFWANSPNRGGTWATLSGDHIFVSTVAWQPDQVVRLGESPPNRVDSVAALNLRTGQEEWPWSKAIMEWTDEWKLPRWRSQIGAGVFSRQRVLFHGQRIYALGNGRADAFEITGPTTVRRLWSVPCPRVYSEALAANALLIGSNDRLLALDPETGKTIDDIAVPGQLRGLAIARGQVFVSTERGEIHALTPRTNPPVVRNPPSGRQSAEANIEWWRRHGLESSTRGFAVVADDRDSRLAQSLAESTSLHVVCVLKTHDLVDRERQRLLAETSLHGSRVSVVSAGSDQGTTLPMVSHFANVVVVAGNGADVAPSELYRVVRPCGGRLILRDADLAPFARLAKVPADEIRGVGDRQAIVRGPLPGSFDWNSKAEADERVRWPLEFQWFGDPNGQLLVSRHARPRTPIPANGRLFLFGESHLTAIDAYNGAELWRRRLGTAICTGVLPVSADDDSLYIHDGGGIWQIDASTGRLVKHFGSSAGPVIHPLRKPLRFAATGKLGDSGVIAIDKSADAIVVTLETQSAAPARPDRWELAFDFRSIEQRLNAPGTGAFEIVVDPWKGQLIAHKSFPLPPMSIQRRPATEEGRSVVDLTFSRAALAKWAGRPIDDFALAADVKLWSDDFRLKLWGRPMLAGGRRGWINEAEAVVVVNDALSLRTPPGQLSAFAPIPRADTGDAPEVALRSGRLPPMTRSRPDGDFAADFKAGIGEDPTKAKNSFLQRVVDFELTKRLHPLTGEEVLRDYSRSYGCSGTSCSAAMDFFRSGTIGMYDRLEDSGMRNISGIRSGCGQTLVAAFGLLVYSESASDCLCSYNFATSLAMAPAPSSRNEDWALFDDRHLTPGLVREAALNLGAPGDRRDANERLWLAFPRPTLGLIKKTALAVPYDFEIMQPSTNFKDTELGPYRINTDRRPIANTDRPWITGSGIKGLSRLRMDLVHHQPAKVLVTLSPEKTPILDGRLDDSCWDGFGGLPFVNRSGVVHFRHDADTLYIAYEQKAGVDRVGKAIPWKASVSEHDGPFERDDHLRLSFFNANGHRVATFAVAAGGGAFDSLLDLGEGNSLRTKKMPIPADDVAWNPEWRHQTARDKTSFRAEIAIPWKTLRDAGIRREGLLVECFRRTRWAGAKDASLAKLLETGIDVHPLEDPINDRFYTVRLHFAELDAIQAGDRVFDIVAQGKTVVENFDVVKQAGGIGRATTLELRDFSASRQLELRFVSKSRYAPMVSGVEVFRQERLEK